MCLNTFKFIYNGPWKSAIYYVINLTVDRICFFVVSRLSYVCKNV